MNSFIKRFFFYLLVFVPVQFTMAQQTGNGGNTVRPYFIIKGEEVLRILELTPLGKKITATHQIDTHLLRTTLNINNLILIDKVLKDNTGSIVDAKVKNGKLFLNDKTWQTKDWKDPMNLVLVFHEMLRLAKIYNDDNYRISLNLYFRNDLNNIENDFELWTKACVENSSGLNLNNSGNCYSDHQKIGSTLNFYMTSDIENDRQHNQNKSITPKENMKRFFASRKLLRTLDFDAIADRAYTKSCAERDSRSSAYLTHDSKSVCSESYRRFVSEVYLELKKQCLEKIIEFEQPDLKSGRHSWGQAFYTWPLNQQAPTIVGCVYELVNLNTNYWQLKE